jgi:23S rRNA (uracil1939-C5)-methyltransferase
MMVQNPMKTQEERSASSLLPGARLRPGDELPVRVEAMASDGRAVAAWGERTIKVEGAIPGELVRVRVFGRDKRTILARAVEVLEASEARTAPRCIHFGDCGGCSWQHVAYPAQLELKRRLLLEALAERGVEHPEVPLPLGVREPWFYRNKMDFDFAPAPAGVAVGLHRRGSYRTLLDLTECFLQSPQTASILASVRELAAREGLEAYDLRSHRGLLRTLLVLESKAGGELLVQLVTSPPEAAEPMAERLRPLAEELRRRHPEISGVLHAVHAGRSNVANPEGPSTLLSGRATIPETIAGIELQVGPQTFLQRNTEQAALLYATVLELAAPAGDEQAIDLYCGLGPITHLLAPHVQSVTGIEVVPEMIDEARRLAAARGVHNVDFLLGTAEEVLPRLAAEMKPRLVVANPPRAGIHRKALRALAAFGAPRLVYVSCSPASLADNLRELIAGGYRVERIQPVDMFPQTPHLETVAALVR